VCKKEADVASAGNPLIHKCCKDALKKLCADLDVKMGQKDEMIEMAGLHKAGHITEESPLRAFTSGENSITRDFIKLVRVA
jgi:hypothetical protein